MSSTRRRVLALYKELHRLGRDYPDPKYPSPFKCIHLKLIIIVTDSYDFNGRMRRMFDSSSHHFPIIFNEPPVFFLRLCSFLVRES